MDGGTRFQRNRKQVSLESPHLIGEPIQHGIRRAAVGRIGNLRLEIAQLLPQGLAGVACGLALCANRLSRSD